MIVVSTVYFKWEEDARCGIVQTWRTPKKLRNKRGDYDDMFRRFLAGRAFEFVTYPALDGVISKSVRDADGGPNI